MKRLLVLLAFLFPSLAFGAAGDITAVRICGTDAALTGQRSARLNTRVAEFEIAGVSTGGTYTLGLAATNNDPTNSRLVFTVTSQGYDTVPALGTGPRTVYGLLAEQKPSPDQATADEVAAGATNCAGGAVPASTTAVRIVLSDFIYANDTVTVSTPGGASPFYSQGGQGNNALVNQAVTNNVAVIQLSTGAYPKSICDWVYPAPYTQVTENFTMEVTCFHRHAAQGKPVAAVVFTVTDAGAAHTVTCKATTMTKSALVALDQHAVLVYACLIDVTTLTQGDVLTANFSAYPWVGDAAAVLTSSDVTGRVVTATKTASGALYAVGDTGTIDGTSCTTKPTYRVLSLTVNAVNTYQVESGGAGCIDTTSAATTASGDQTGLGSGMTITIKTLEGLAGRETMGPLLLLNDKSGTYGNPAAYIDPVNGVAVATSPCTSASPCNVRSTLALGETAYSGDPTISYKTPGDSMIAIRNYNNRVLGRNNPSGGIGVLVDCSAATGVTCSSVNTVDAHRLPGVTGGALGAQETWFTLQPRTGVTAAKAIMNNANGVASCAGATDISVGIEKLRFNGVSISDDNGATFCLATIKGSASLTIGTRFLIENSTINLQNTTAGAYTFLTGYVMGATVTNLKGPGFTQFSTTHGVWKLIRGVAGPAAAITSNAHTTVGSTQLRPQLDGPTNSAVQADHDGFIYAFNSVASLAAATQFSALSTGSTSVSANVGAAVIQNSLEHLCSTCNTSQPIMNLCADGTSASCRNVMIWHNTFIGERSSLCYNDGTSLIGVTGAFLHTYWSVRFNIFPTVAMKSDTFATEDGGRVLNWGCRSQTGNYGNWIMPNSIVASPPSASSIYGPTSGMYSIIKQSHVSTGGVSYVAIKDHVAVTATNKPGSGTGDATCPTWQTCWSAIGATTAPTAIAWANGVSYYAIGFTDDKSGYTGSNAGGGDYTLLSTSPLINMAPVSFSPLPYDLAGRARWTGDGGAFSNPADAPPVGACHGNFLLLGVGGC